MNHPTTDLMSQLFGPCGRILPQFLISVWPQCRRRPHMGREQAEPDSLTQLLAGPGQVKDVGGGQVGRPLTVEGVKGLLHLRHHSEM